METTPRIPTTDTDVLIVGAGPTGLTLATTLCRAGVTPLVVEKLATGQNTSRAAVIHAHTLEVLQSLGVAETLTREGLKVPKFSLRDRDTALISLRFDRLPSPFAHLLMLPQDITERVLRDSLVEEGGEVQWNSTVQQLVETPHYVEAIVATPQGPKSVRARYVVGADGMHSIVRETAGIGLSGSSFEETFVLADIDMSWGHGSDEVMLFFSPAGLLVVAPLPDNRYRLVATFDDAPEHVDLDHVQALLDTRGPTYGRAHAKQVFWTSRFRLHHRIADGYRKGRLLLVGDAAHVHSPAGGQGMNTGIVDAYVLGRILADVVSGRADSEYLDRYEALRRPAAKQVLKLAGRLTHMATLRNTPQRILRNTALRALGHLPKFREGMQLNLSGISRRHAAELGAG